MASSTDDLKRHHTIDEIENWNLNRAVDPPTKVIGLLGYNGSQAYEYISSNSNRLFVSGSFTSTSAPLSADGSSVSAIQEGANRLRVSAIQDDATNFDVSAKSNDAGTMHVSAYSNDAGQLRVSALGVTLASAQALSATLKEGTSFVGSVSANQAGTWSISALAKEGTSFIGNVSAKNTDAVNFHISAKSDSAGQIRTSAFSDNANLLRVSADLIAQTTGNLSIYNSLSVSSAAAVKSSAGAIYGYYAWNSDTKYNYIKLYNLSAGVTLGTDTPILTIGLPASAAANVEYPHGLAGFTAGISIAATSAVAHNATSLPATSAVGVQLFYK